MFQYKGQQRQQWGQDHVGQMDGSNSAKGICSIEETLWKGMPHGRRCSCLVLLLFLPATSSTPLPLLLLLLQLVIVVVAVEQPQY